jgi:general secretion pathway protein D
MVITPQSKYLPRVEEWLERLDLGGGQAGQRLYVYDVTNVKAADLATTLGEVFGSGGGNGGARAAAPSGDRLMPGLEPVEIRTVGTSGNVSPSPGTNDGKSSGDRSGNYANDGSASGKRDNASGGGGSESGGGIALGASDEVRISASEENNALLVKATPGQWDSIRRVIERLDTIPLQVHIEAQIVRVALNNSLNFGVRWFFENSIAGDGVPPRANALGRNGWGDHGGAFGSGIGVNWSFIGPDAVAIINTLDSITETTVISAPSLVVLNNKSANINVGTQLPVVSSFYGGGVGNNDPTTPNTGFNQSYVQFRQTGITLNVTPRVNPGGLVFMEIEQEESTPGAQADAVGGNVPVDNRSISTEIAVQSGETVLLGGLIRENNGQGRSGVPFLSRIPLFGAFFGINKKTSEREELLVLITPRVIRNGDEARRLTDDYSRQFRALEPLRVRIENQESK